METKQAIHLKDVNPVEQAKMKDGTNATQEARESFEEFKRDHSLQVQLLDLWKAQNNAVACNMVVCPRCSMMFKHAGLSTYLRACKGKGGGEPGKQLSKKQQATR